MFIPDPDPGCSFRVRMFIPDPGSGSLFFVHPGSCIQGGVKKAPDPDLQHWFWGNFVRVPASVAYYSDYIFRSDFDAQQHSVHSALYPAAAGAESRRCLHRILAPGSCPGNHRWDSFFFFKQKQRLIIYFMVTTFIYLKYFTHTYNHNTKILI